MMKPAILFLEQQSWRSGAQRVLSLSLGALSTDFVPIVAFPEAGPFAEELAARGIETITFPLGMYRSGRKSAMEMASFPLRSLTCGLLLARLIEQRNVKLIYINGPRCLAAGVLAARITARPSLFHLHLTLSRRAEALVTARLARSASVIVACSEAAAMPLLAVDQNLRQKTRVVYNPAPAYDPQQDRNQTTWTKSTDPFVFGTVGRLTEQKGHPVLLQAADLLSAKSKARVRLLIVGSPAPNNKEDTAYVKHLGTQASMLNLAQQITWAGYQKDPSPFYDSMGALVQPSLEDCGEAMPLVILEALQSGVPVIASKTGGIPELIRDGENGILVPAGDATALARALERFMSDDLLRHRLCSSTRTWTDDRFSPARFRSSLRELVGDLCSSGRQRNIEISNTLAARQ